MNEGYVHQILLDKKIKPNYEFHDVIRTADLRRTFSKQYTTNWSYKVYKITEVIKDTIPCYHIDKLPERYDEGLLEQTKLSMKK